MITDQVQEEIIDEFVMFDQWLDRYNYIIELSRDLEPMNEAHRNDKFLIQGCQSRVWVDAELTPEGTVVYHADSDAIITKGIIALLIRVLSGRTPDEIINTELYFIDKIGLKENLSPTRANGLLSMMKQMKLYAIVFKSELSK